MLVLTEDALLTCTHKLGKLNLQPAQDWVRVQGRRVLIDPDPERRDIDGCPNVNVNMKKCGKSLRVQVGYSTFVHIGGKSICLDNVRGLTDGTPPGATYYEVDRAGQTFVSEAP